MFPCEYSNQEEVVERKKYGKPQQSYIIDSEVNISGNVSESRYPRYDREGILAVNFISKGKKDSRVKILILFSKELGLIKKKKKSRQQK